MNETGCYLFHCDTPSVCLFSASSDFSSVRLRPRNLHHIQSVRVKDDNYATASRPPNFHIPATTTAAKQTIAFTSADVFTRKSGEYPPYFNVYCCFIMLHNNTSSSSRSFDMIVSISLKPMSHEREKSVDKADFWRPTILADKNLSSDIKLADVGGKLLPDWLTADTIATTCNQRDSRNHSGCN